MKSLKNNFKKTTIKDISADFCLIFLGSALYSFAFVYFLDPNRISPGGITGMAAVINYIFPFLPTGTVLLALNIPIIFLGFFKIGGKFIIKTFYATTLVSFLINIFEKLLPEYKGERLLAAVFGGVFAGLGLAVVMLRGGTTGGTDVLAKVMRMRFPYFSIGRMVMALDGIVVLIAAVTYKDLETALYSAVTLFAASKMLDAVLYGFDTGKLLFIVTNKPKEVSAALFEAVCRGVTLVSCKGGYRNEDRSLLLCALRNQEVDKAVKTIKTTDNSAFTIVTATGGVFGEGFEKKV